MLFNPLIHPLLFPTIGVRGVSELLAPKGPSIRDRTTIHPTEHTASIAVQPLITSMQQINGDCVIDEAVAMLLLGEWYNQEESWP